MPQPAQQRYRFSYADIHHTLGLAAQEVIESGLEFDYILAIGGGGYIPARILRTYLNRPILSVALSRYSDDAPPSDTPLKLQWTEGFAEAIRGKRLLVVDDVDDQRTTLAWCLNELNHESPSALSVLVLHDKNKPKNAEYPDYVDRVFVGQRIEDYWVEYPWDALDIYGHEETAQGLVDVEMPYGSH
ncbi:phosphoribosyltransferase [Litorivicinus lipolyticus]|uniref:phosphoribosyltransferase n=1 Tax=Litorivicinus lipolyticus TaxID=418701 RepID=UPI003B595300